jgi:hypothetical protein
MELAPGTLPPPRFTRFSSLLADHSSCQDVWLPGPSGGRSKPLSLLGGRQKLWYATLPETDFFSPNASVNWVQCYPRSGDLFCGSRQRVPRIPSICSSYESRITRELSILDRASGGHFSLFPTGQHDRTHKVNFLSCTYILESLMFICCTESAHPQPCARQIKFFFRKYKTTIAGTTPA